MSYMEPVEPVITQRRKYKPKVEDKITIDLPGERTRAIIMDIFNEDVVVAEITSTTIAQPMHGHKKGDKICCRRDVNGIGTECWSLISDLELRQAESVARIERDERDKAAAAELERIEKQRAVDLAARPVVAIVEDSARNLRTSLGPRRSKIARKE